MNTIRRLLLALTLLTAENVFACSCVQWPENIEDAVQMQFDRAESVVLAKAENIEDIKIEETWGNEQYSHNGEKTTFSTLRSWKGSIGDSFTTEIVTDCCMCGASFELNDEYLLFLYKSESESFYTTSICTGNKLKEYAKEEISVLGQIAPNK